MEADTLPSAILSEAKSLFMLFRRQCKASGYSLVAEYCLAYMRHCIHSPTASPSINKPRKTNKRKTYKALCYVTDTAVVFHCASRNISLV